MALAPVDFYAYSRATGVPMPESPEERVALAPEVLEFRKNQLSQPKEGVDFGQLIGASALGAGALAGLGFAARRLLGRGTQVPKGPAVSATSPVRTVNLQDLADRASSSVTRAASQEAREAIDRPAPSKVATPGRVEPEFEAYRPDPKELLSRQVADARRQAATEGLLRAAETRRGSYQASIPGVPTTLMELRSKELGIDPAEMGLFQGEAPSYPLSQAPKQFSIFDTLTEAQNATLPSQITQSVNAVESGSGQIAGRVIKQLNFSDPWGETTVPPSVVNKQTATLLLPPAAVSLREQAQSFLQSRFEELGAAIPGRYRRERTMGLDPGIAEAVELYASTGDPAVLSRLSKTPSSPLTVAPRVQTELETPDISTGKFYQATGQGEFIDDLFEKDINLTNKISALGTQKQTIVNRLEEIDQLEPQLRFAAADEPEQGGYYTRMLNKMLFEKQSLNPESVNVDIGDALAERDFVRNQMESLEALGTQYKPLKQEEGVRPFFEVEKETGEIIPETLEIRSGRPSVQLEEQKTSGGREYAIYDPTVFQKSTTEKEQERRAAFGSSIGIYGIEPRDYPIADPELKPTALQREETKNLKPRRGEYPEFKTVVKSTPEQKLQSLQISEALRRARIEGRDPQDFLRRFGGNI